MKITVLTLFPGMFEGVLGESIVKRAIEKGVLEVELINIRDFAFNKHKSVDDYSFGGGAGMVMKPEPFFEILKSKKDVKTLYMSPQGKVFDQKLAIEFSKEQEIIMIAGHYEGIDERVIEEFVDMEVSVGDYVLTGGELPAMVIIDAITRLLPDVINEESFTHDSFFNGLLDYPHYTRPADYEGKTVPEILLSGHHENIRKWQMKQSLKRTMERRPDILKDREYSKEELKIIKEIKEELKK